MAPHRSGSCRPAGGVPRRARSASFVEQVGQPVVAVDADGPLPAQVVQPDVLELDPLRVRPRSASASRRCSVIATLHSPSARWPSSMSAWVTIPTGFVKSTIQASGRRAAGHQLGELEDRRGTVRIALAKPPAPGRLLADDAEAERERLVDADARPGRRPAAGGARSRRRRARRRDRRSACSRPVQPSRSSIRCARPPTTVEALGIDVEQDELVDGQAVRASHEALDQLGRVRAPAADDRDLGAHPPSHPSADGRVLTRLLITLSAIRQPAQAHRSAPSDHGGAACPMARFRLELGPVPMHHQVYLDLRGSLDSGRWRRAIGCRPERELAQPLRLQPDHHPAGARRARARGSHRADPRPRHVRPPSAHRSRHRRPRQLHRGDAGSAAWTPRHG